MGEHGEPGEINEFTCWTAPSGWVITTWVPQTESLKLGVVA